MERIIFILFSVFFTFQASYAQEVYKKKNVLKEVRAFNKSQNYSKAADALDKAFTSHEAARTDAELLNWAMNMQYQLTQQENRKIYLNNNPDTARYFNTILKVYNFGLACDSADNIPNQKGVVKPRYASNIGNKLFSTRNNLRSGGKFFYKQRKYAESYALLDMYLQTLGHSLIATAAEKSGQLSTLDADSLEMARLAVVAAYGANQPANVLQHVATALRDTTNRQLIYELQAKAYEQLGDSMQYLSTLHKAQQEFPLGQFFYSSLITYYNAHSDYNASLRIVNQLVQADDHNRTFWYLKGRIHQCLEQTDSAVHAYHQAIQIHPDDAESYAALGSVYLEQAHSFYEQTNLRIGAKNYATNRRKLNAYYQNARESYEQSRKYDELNKERWLEPLREIYFKLNMGRELRALEKTFPNPSIGGEGEEREE